jgi:hypothetical protein
VFSSAVWVDENLRFLTQHWPSTTDRCFLYACYDNPIKWDWSAIEAKLAAAYSGDDEDLDLFAREADIHVATLCRMYRYPLSPDLMDPHKAPNCADWRAQVAWQANEDWGRTAAKTSRYSLAYAADKRGIHQAKDVDKLARLAWIRRASRLWVRRIWTASRG